MKLRKACGNGGRSSKAKSDLAGFLRTEGRQKEERCASGQEEAGQHLRMLRAVAVYHLVQRNFSILTAGSYFTVSQLYVSLV